MALPQSKGSSSRSFSSKESGTLLKSGSEDSGTSGTKGTRGTRSSAVPSTVPAFSPGAVSAGLGVALSVGVLVSFLVSEKSNSKPWPKADTGADAMNSDNPEATTFRVNDEYESIPGGRWLLIYKAFH